MASVLTFDPQKKEAEQRKADLLEVLDVLREQVEAGKIKELVGCSIDDEGECQLHVAVRDFPGGVGLFEIGKTMLMHTQMMDEF